MGTSTPTSFGGGYRTLAIAGTGTEGGMIQSMVGSTGALFIGTNSTQSFISEPRNVFMTFSTNDIERMRISSGGNVGIGSNSPDIYGFGSSGKYLTLQSVSGGFSLIQVISDSTSGAGIVFGSTTIRRASIEGTNGSDLLFSTNASNSGTSNTERMRIDSAGAIVIKGASTTSLLRGLIENFNSYFNIYATEGGGLTKDFGLFNGGSASAEGIIIKASGRVLIGTTTDNGERLYVSGSIRATGSITANSDVRLKKNIERIENALQKVSEISGYTYNTIYDEDRHAGVIAQEIDKVLPEIVNKGNDGLMGVEYGNISALLIEAIKDLKAKNEKLEAIVEGLRK